MSVVIKKEGVRKNHSLKQKVTASLAQVEPLKPIEFDPIGHEIPLSATNSSASLKNKVVSFAAGTVF